MTFLGSICKPKELQRIGDHKVLEPMTFTSKEGAFMFLALS
jgi:hypothetical protein